MLKCWENGEECVTVRRLLPSAACDVCLTTTDLLTAYTDFMHTTLQTSAARTSDVTSTLTSQADDPCFTANKPTAASRCCTILHSGRPCCLTVTTPSLTQATWPRSQLPTLSVILVSYSHHSRRREVLQACNDDVHPRCQYTPRFTPYQCPLVLHSPTSTMLLSSSTMPRADGNTARYEPLAKAEESQFLPSPRSALSSLSSPSLLTHLSSYASLDQLKQRPVSLTAIVGCACILLYLLLGGSSTGLSSGRVPIDVNLLLSNDSTPYTQIRKIDELGVYRQFDDITTVMKVHTTATSLFNDTHAFLTNHSDLVSPLPVSSYHVTLVEVIGLKRVKSLSAYNERITTNLARLEQLQYHFTLPSPANQQPITFHLRHATYGEPDGRFASGITLLLKPDTATDAERLEGLLRMAREVLGSELWVEPVGWHMTLGYKPDVVAKKKCMGGCYRGIVDELNAMYADVKIVCDPPILSAVHDMLAFPPV